MPQTMAARRPLPISTLKQELKKAKNANALPAIKEFLRKGQNGSGLVDVRARNF